MADSNATVQSAGSNRRYSPVRRAATAALVAAGWLGLGHGAVTVADDLGGTPRGAQTRRDSGDVDDPRIGRLLERLDAANGRADSARADLEAARARAMAELTDSAEFRRMLRDADDARNRLEDEVGRALERLASNDARYRQARAARATDDYVPSLRDSEARAAEAADRLRATEQAALDEEPRVREARADALRARESMDDLYRRYQDRVRDFREVADAADRVQDAEARLADVMADLRDAGWRGGETDLAGVEEEDRYIAPPQEVVTSYERDLSPSGRWVEVANYGRCFVPNGIERDWRPYTRGSWADSDQGWTWVPDEREADWGQICYHYGRWTYEERVGWCWVPGTVWAPAWVAWREGGDYCGWAPLPPSTGVVVRRSITDRIPVSHFTFVEERHMSAPRVHDHVIAVERNTTIINNTTNITNVTVINNRVVNRGVETARIEKASGRRVERVQLASATTPVEARKLRAEGKPVRYEPPVVRQAAEERLAQATRVQRRLTDAAATARPAAARPAGAGAPGTGAAGRPAAGTETPARPSTPGAANASANPSAGTPAASTAASGSSRPGVSSPATVRPGVSSPGSPASATSIPGSPGAGATLPGAGMARPQGSNPPVVATPGRDPRSSQTPGGTSQSAGTAGTPAHGIPSAPGTATPAPGRPTDPGRTPSALPGSPDAVRQAERDQAIERARSKDRTPLPGAATRPGAATLTPPAAPPPAVPGGLDRPGERPRLPDPERDRTARPPTAAPTDRAPTDRTPASGERPPTPPGSTPTAGNPTDRSPSSPGRPLGVDRSAERDRALKPDPSMPDRAPERVKDLPPDRQVPGAPGRPADSTGAPKRPGAADRASDRSSDRAPAAGSTESAAQRGRPGAAGRAPERDRPIDRGPGSASPNPGTPAPATPTTRPAPPAPSPADLAAERDKAAARERAKQHPPEMKKDPAPAPR